MAVIRAMASWFVAFICDLTYGASGGFVDLSDWRTELERTAARVAELEERVNPAPRRFEAYTDCPKCGRMDHHWLRAPLPKPEPGPARVVSDHDDALLAFLQECRAVAVERWDGMSGPDESMFEVIRICTGCRHEWGML